MSSLTRDRLLARLAEMGDAPDHQRLAAEVLGIRGAPPELARKLVAQALVLEDRQAAWHRTGERICRDAPDRPAVYVLKSADGTPLYVGKAVNLRRRLRAHFANRRWRGLKPGMSRAADVEWTEVGSDLEALLREASLIAELQPPVNVQTGPPEIATREIPRALVRDVVIVAPSIEEDSAELVAARASGEWMIQRTRRSGADLAVHARRIFRFFSPLSDLRRRTPGLFAPIVFSWLAGRRGEMASRIDPHDARDPKALARRLAALLRDERLFHERLEQC